MFLFAYPFVSIHELDVWALPESPVNSAENYAEFSAEYHH